MRVFYFHILELQFLTPFLPKYRIWTFSCNFPCKLNEHSLSNKKRPTFICTRDRHVSIIAHNKYKLVVNYALNYLVMSLFLNFVERNMKMITKRFCCLSLFCKSYFWVCTQLQHLIELNSMLHAIFYIHIFKTESFNLQTITMTSV